MIELVAIGDEVLYGYTLNGNASFMAQQLLEHGFLVTKHTVVADNAEDVEQVLTEALQRGACVIVTGGLGPTCDDLTRAIVAQIFAVRLSEPENLREKLIGLYGADFVSAKREVFENQLLQPEGAHLFENRLGSASGFAIQDSKRFPGGHLICLPGVPQEMRAMFTDSVIDYIKKCGIDSSAPGMALCIEPLHFHTVKEPEVDQVLRMIQQKIPEVSFGIYPGYSTVSVHIKTKQKDFSDALRAKKLLLEHFHAYQFTSASGKLTQAVHDLMIEKNITLCCAESCTGGALCASFVQYPDASKYVQATIVAYSNEMKETLLGVERATIEAFGAVSCEVTNAMAKGVRARCGSDCAVAVSGIFGPSGGSISKPVGTVCATIVYKEIAVHSWTMHFKGNRAAILERTVQAIHAELYSLVFALADK